MPEPVTPPGETVVVASTESSAAPQAPGSAVAEPAKVATPETPVVDVENLQKQLEKLTMENNLHKNRIEKIDKEKEDARQAELSEVEKLKEQLAQANADKSQRQAKDFRDSILNDYLKDSPAALKAAQALISKNPLNLAWGEGLTEDEAKAELTSQLDALKEVVGETAQVETPPKQRSNNPRVQDEPDPDEAQLVVEARKTGDWSKYINRIPSVRKQIDLVSAE